MMKLVALLSGMNEGIIQRKVDPGLANPCITDIHLRSRPGSDGIEGYVIIWNTSDVTIAKVKRNGLPFCRLARLEGLHFPPTR